MSSDLDTLVTEITLQNERIVSLENGLKQLRSQLIDVGASKDSVLILSIDNLLNND